MWGDGGRISTTLFSRPTRRPLSSSVASTLETRITRTTRVSRGSRERAILDMINLFTLSCYRWLASLLGRYPRIGERQKEVARIAVVVVIVGRQEEDERDEGASGAYLLPRGEYTALRARAAVTRPERSQTGPRAPPSSSGVPVSTRPTPRATTSTTFLLARSSTAWL